jgi:hypothetical protein
MNKRTYFVSLNSRDFSGPDMYSNYHFIILQKKPSELISLPVDQLENP